LDFAGAATGDFLRAAFFGMGCSFSFESALTVPFAHTVADEPGLSTEEKRDIFYNNAARFLRLK
jgi:hypothetical protein